MSSIARAAQVLGTCHTQQGQHALAVAALDAGINEAKARTFFLSESMAVRTRAQLGLCARDGGGSESHLHWDAEERDVRLQEVMGRMQGGRGVLKQAVLLTGS